MIQSKSCQPNAWKTWGSAMSNLSKQAEKEYKKPCVLYIMISQLGHWICCQSFSSQLVNKNDFMGINKKWPNGDFEILYDNSGYLFKKENVTIRILYFFCCSTHTSTFEMNLYLISFSLFPLLMWFPKLSQK